MKRITILFFVFLAAHLVVAGPGTGTPFSLLPTVRPVEDICNLPAPNNLEVVSETSSSITVEWDPVPGAIGYDVAAFEPGTNNQYPATPVFWGFTSATLSPLPSGTPVEIRVSAICTGNQVSPNISTVLGFTDVVIEIVSSGYNCNNLPNYGTPHNLTQEINYTVQLGNNAPVFKFMVSNETPNSPVDSFEMKITDKARFHMLSSGGVFGGNQNVGTFAASREGSSIFTFNVSSTGTSSAILNLHPGAASAGYSIQMSQPMCGSSNDRVLDESNNDKWEELPGSESHNTDNLEIQGGGATISPMPFDDFLKIRFAGDGEFSTNANIRLFTVSGAFIESRTVAANTQNNVVELNTADLAPGLYVLQIQTAQGSVTKLVTKMAH